MDTSAGARPSPFLEPTSRTAPNTLAIISLSKEHYQPITLQESIGAVDGYAEGVTLNTRFGSFPHSTLLDIPWGSQVRASVVDTGSRGRKRRRDQVEDEETPTSNQDDGNDTPTSAPAKKAIAASSGFIYVLRPTPELWTSSLPHRTQVVYTPDYSYVLQRIRARPGTRIIEAGAGSGSFTHASARAVYSGYPGSDADARGKVFSFEFHEPRFEKMDAEIKQHSLQGIVQVTHRDVYDEGFLINGKSPKASAVFLDLPAPWEALHHLARRKTLKGGKLDENPGDWDSPLDPNKSAYICTFSPCIEQVTRTVTELRTLGWTDIDMVEIAHRRFNVIRDRAGVNIPSEKGFSAQPADVAEAVKKLKSDLKRTQDFHKAQTSQPVSDTSESKMDVDESTPESNTGDSNKNEDPLWLQGRLVHRTENDLKTHTSYLVFAILPREWDEAAEEAALAKWPCGGESKTIGNLDKQARKQEKREMMAGKKQKRARTNDAQTA
ncbi:tRNA (adenine-N(1)-)-methyltransferase catalytic subunit [Metarhizium anisopliae BRIP 53293]|uniref:tRNA (adenine(58)-N(1))-methyltransferase catalytic subunit TRM61 n=1 Tax=Metarhizium anisopliae BRIP 53293 TaxID=1291518 RepID=A0A0D9P381_METAN|nr:tRNA (adenine-N(1)-)-methyltransferase catalytic subunit [Metarhizium anisopliae BRIP 53293]KJK95050.1 tRNA (adenine-N(1)-)-methyltransferase catalytic subunit [Metarhizium anisopliae BRIP 53284]